MLKKKKKKKRFRVDFLRQNFITYQTEFMRFHGLQVNEFDGSLTFEFEITYDSIFLLDSDMLVLAKK